MEDKENLDCKIDIPSFLNSYSSKNKKSFNQIELFYEAIILKINDSQTKLHLFSGPIWYYCGNPKGPKGAFKYSCQSVMKFLETLPYFTLNLFS